MANEITIQVNDRIRLTEIRSSDKAAFVALLNDKEIYQSTLRIPYPYTEADAEWFINNVKESTARQGYATSFAIRNDQEQLIGGCGFQDFTSGHCAEIGYWLGKPYWGQGIMTDVIRSACDFAFAEWNLVRITAPVFDFNTASARVVEKNGFVLEGLLRKNRRKDGRFINSKLYALVK